MSLNVLRSLSVSELSVNLPQKSSRQTAGSFSAVSAEFRCPAADFCPAAAEIFPEEMSPKSRKSDSNPWYDKNRFADKAEGNNIVATYTKLFWM